MSKTQEKYEYKAEMKQLLHLIIHSLYQHPDVFLRELISNASDALNKVRFEELTNKDFIDHGSELKIKIDVDEKKNTFSITDNGIGMTHDELVENLGTIAKSGTLEFIEKVKNAKEDQVGDLIGQFGVGFYSIFMVTDSATVETRHAGADSKGYTWKSDGQGNFTIEESDIKTRGTKISFTLKEEYKEYAKEYTIKDTIQKYSNFAEFPIFVGEEQTNTLTALWQKQTSEIEEKEAHEFYKYISNDFTEPLKYYHLSIEGNANFKSLLFIPKTAPMDIYRLHEEKSLHLYTKKILIQNNCKELLPEYLRFVAGVVDTEDLPLNVSREVTQLGPQMARIKKVLTSKILGFLDKLASSEEENYLSFYKNFGVLFITGVNSDFENRDKIIDLLRFESTHTKEGELTSLKEYVLRMKEEQKEIYYVTGESKNAIQSNPNLEYFKKHDIEVLLLTNPSDIFSFPGIGKYEEKELKPIDKSNLDLFKEEEKKETPDNKVSEGLIKIFKETLGDKVENVIESKRLVDSAVTLVAGEQGLDAQTERMMKMMNQGFTGSKKILEVNLEHPLVRNLSKLSLAGNQPEIIKQCIQQLYDGALLMESNLESPADYVKRMTAIMEEATK